jgi:integrase/recombinase XerD
MDAVLRPAHDADDPRLRGQSSEAKSLRLVVQDTLKLWRKHHLTYDQSKQVVAQVRRALQLSPPRPRRRTVERLDRVEVTALIDAAYRRSSRHGLMVKTLFYTGARVSEFIHIQVTDLYLHLDPPQIYLAQAKGGSDGYVPILPALAQELQTHLAGRRRGYLFESNRGDKYTPRYIQLVVHEAAAQAGIAKQVTPHRLRASVATILLDAGMPLDHVQKFLRHKRIATTQIYAETSLRGLGETYIHALDRRSP